MGDYLVGVGGVSPASDGASALEPVGATGEGSPIKGAERIQGGEGQEEGVGEVGGVDGTRQGGAVDAAQAAQGSGAGPEPVSPRTVAEGVESLGPVEGAPGDDGGGSDARSRLVVGAIANRLGGVLSPENLSRLASQVLDIAGEDLELAEILARLTGTGTGGDGVDPAAH